MHTLALATDYDGTLATHGVVDEATLEALYRARAAGLQVWLVTGRELQGVFDVFPQWKLFDRMVVENGAVLFDPATGVTRTVAPTPPAEFVERLKARGVPISVGNSIVSTREPHDVAMRETIAELGIDWHVIMNNDAAMALPRGVDKAFGLEALMAELKIDPAQVASVGDAENDIAFVQACGYPVAVANAIPALKSVATWVTPGERGMGVTQLIDRLLEELGDTTETPSIADV